MHATSSWVSPRCVSPVHPFIPEQCAHFEQACWKLQENSCSSVAGFVSTQFNSRANLCLLRSIKAHWKQMPTLLQLQATYLHSMDASAFNSSAVYHAMQLQDSMIKSMFAVQTSIEELTGSCKRLDRQDLWELPYKRIFFCTPQTFRNDVDRGTAASVHCLMHSDLPCTQFSMPVPSHVLHHCLSLTICSDKW